jgi:glycerophosphoryl diester phosphodiesterase
MGGVSVVAHRNASGDFPENTAVAFQEAIDLGVDMIEFDVQLTADRCLVICHDPSVDRTSDGAGRIGEMCMAAIEELDAGSWFSDKYAGERFATLGETLDMMPGGMRLNVHIKASDESRDALVPLVVDELVRRNLTASSFATGNASTARRAGARSRHVSSRPFSFTNLVSGSQPLKTQSQLRRECRH